MEEKITIEKDYIATLLNDKTWSDIVPSSGGLMLFKQGNDLLFIVRISNAVEFFNSLFVTGHKSLTDKLAKILDRYDKIEFVVINEPLKALAAEKRLLLRDKPEFYGYVRLSDQFVYLALQVDRPPYITIQNDTAGDDFYIGPFKNSFFLIDIIETFAKLRKTPACEPYFKDSAPNVGAMVQMSNAENEFCDSEKEDRCLKYCEADNKEDLIRLLEDVYVNYDASLLSQLRQDCEILYDNLHFLRADDLNKRLPLVSKYYDHLTFFKVIKKMNYCLTDDGIDYYIKKGVLEKIVTGSEVEIFEEPEEIFNDYRDNEVLALPKNRLTEMWIIFDKIRRVNPKRIEELMPLERTTIF